MSMRGSLTEWFDEFESDVDQIIKTPNEGRYFIRMVFIPGSGASYLGGILNLSLGAQVHSRDSLTCSLSLSRVAVTGEQ